MTKADKQSAVDAVNRHTAAQGRKQAQQADATPERWLAMGQPWLASPPVSAGETETRT